MNYQIDIKNIDESSAIRICTQMLAIDANNTKYNEKNTIDLLINSDGGYLVNCFQICDMMDYIKTPIITIGLEKVYSAGVFILMNAKRYNRFCYKNTKLMSRRPRLVSKNGDIVDNISTDCYKLVLEHYEKNTFISKRRLSETLLLLEDTFFSPEDALSYGIIDGIL